MKHVLCSIFQQQTALLSPGEPRSTVFPITVVDRHQLLPSSLSAYGYFICRQLNRHACFYPIASVGQVVKVQSLPVNIVVKQRERIAAIVETETGAAVKIH